ncbi:hypothetical protein AGOR_G00217740 [Albula goreensis]|uniref:Uncharacterized protein n=1 Tax=Albula goreensis TaxID=1534307 RepID=A0A8T3CML0_9TELE|nr:hypothetical protein AGOR_G00217740 [Albula goreensis]
MKHSKRSDLTQVNGATAQSTAAERRSNSDNSRGSSYLDQHYEEKVRPCIDLIDSLSSLGVEKDLDLPAIAVIGDQSSGKSSVLEALSGVALPRGSGIVTRCPLILKLKKVKRGKPWTGLMTFKQNNNTVKWTLKSPEKVGEAVELAQEAIAGKGQAISNDMITLEIESPEVPDLTLIDLPGIARVAVGNQPSDIGDQIKKMIRNFIKRQATISLVVVPANIDIATTEALKMAKEVDPSGQRTLGVLTKPDLVDRGAEGTVVNTVNNLVINLKKGYMVVKCRGQQDINDNMTLDKAIQKERAFFEDHPHFRTLLDNGKASIPCLAEKLTKELVEHISKSLPQLEKQINQKLEINAKKLRDLGNGVPADQTQRTNFLIEKVNKFNNVLLEVVRAEEVVEEGDTRVFTKIRTEFSNWKIQLDMKANKLEEHLRDEVDEYSRTRRGKELPGFVNYKTFEGIVKQHIQDMEEPSVLVLRNVTEIVRNSMNKIAGSHFEMFSHLLRVTKTHMEDLREQENGKAEKKLRSQFSMEQTVYSQDCLYSYQLSAVKQRGSPFGMNADLKEMAQHVSAYFKIASDRLANQVPLIIQYHMLDQYVSHLQTAMTGIVGQGESLSLLLREDSGKSYERENLKNSVDRLREARQLLAKSVLIA